MTAALDDLPVLKEGEDKIDMFTMASFHEVAHCMVAEQSGLRTSKLRIQRRFLSDCVDGGTYLDLENTPGVYVDPDDPRMYHVEDEHVHAFLLCCVAGWRGAAAWFREVQGTEEAIYGTSPDYGCSCDFKAFNAVSRGFGLSKSRAAAEADALIRMHWGRIRAASAVLRARKRINASQVVNARDRSRAAIKPKPDAQ